MVVDVYLKQMTGSESRSTSLLNCKSSIILWELWMRLHPSHSLSSPLPLSHLILSCPMVLTVTHYSLLDDFLSVPILPFTSVRVEHTGGWGLAVLHGLVCQSRVLFTFSTIEFEPEFNCFYATLLFSSTVRLHNVFVIGVKAVSRQQSINPNTENGGKSVCLVVTWSKLNQTTTTDFFFLLMHLESSKVDFCLFCSISA